MRHKNVYKNTALHTRRGEELGMSTRFDNIIGNESLRHRMAQDIDLGTLAHAYIIEGPVGSGRRTLTLSVICALACTPLPKKAFCKLREKCSFVSVITPIAVALLFTVCIAYMVDNSFSPFLYYIF
jgi:hypothetical protein